ncbi:MAG: hydroxyacid dehydrogenase [Rhodospirillaceae bacterium]|nr:hydroxyacid dehydrogenase [Rhodospirillaceae bacterium]
MRPKVVVTNLAEPAAISVLTPHADVVANDRPAPWSRKELIERSGEAFGILAFMTDAVDDDLLRRCRSLQIVAGALKGADNIDVAACSRRGIWVSVVPDLLSAPTADLAVGLLLALSRNLVTGDRLVRSGGFTGWRPILFGRGLEGATVGIVGMGTLGRALARRLRAFGCRLLYVDDHPLPPTEERLLAVERRRLAVMAAEADILVLALPLEPRSVHLVNRRLLATLRPGCLLINAARGSLVDEEAVADFLEEGRLGGYAADVFAFEDMSRADRPRTVPDRLRAMPDRTVLTPHLGSAVADARRAIVTEAALNIVDCLEGRRPRCAINDPESRQ